MGRYDSDDDDDLGQESETNLVRDLRRQLKAKDRELSDLRTKFEDRAKADRQSTVEAVLNTRGLNPKIAGLIPPDLLERDAIDKWVADFADVFGPAAPASQEPAVAPDERAALGKMDQATTSGAPEATETLIKRVQGMSYDELMAEINKAQGAG